VVASVKSDAHGYFSVALPPGRYVITDSAIDDEYAAWLPGKGRASRAERGEGGGGAFNSPYLLSPEVWRACPKRRGRSTVSPVHRQRSRPPVRTPSGGRYSAVTTSSAIFASSSCMAGMAWL
jgi:hypothetical protein